MIQHLSLLELLSGNKKLKILSEGDEIYFMSGTRLNFLFWNLFFLILGALLYPPSENTILIYIFFGILNFYNFYKRVINCGWNGFWVLLMLIPIINIFFFLLLHFKKPNTEKQILQTSEEKNIKGEELKINIEHSTREKEVKPISVEENYLFEKVSEEIADDKLHKATWTKAFAESNGQIDLTKSLYIKYRVASLKEEIRVNQEARLDAEEKEKLRTKEKQEQRKSNRNMMIILLLGSILIGYLVYFLFV
tara:strand:- start:76 stop:825 length:750 start_codon:yes stop_codon:yes gene_type:complete